MLKKKDECVVYLLGVMEACSVLLVFELGRLHVVLQPPEVVLSKLGLLVRLEALVEGWLLSLVVLSIDSCASSLRERLAEQVLGLDLGHVACISWHMLSFQVLSGATEPVLASL